MSNYTKFGYISNEKGSRGPPGVGFKLTENGDYDIQEKDLVNIDSVYLDNIFENTANGNININNTIDLKTNNVINCDQITSQQVFIRENNSGATLPNGCQFMVSTESTPLNILLQGDRLNTAGEPTPSIIFSRDAGSGWTIFRCNNSINRTEILDGAPSESARSIVFLSAAISSTTNNLPTINNTTELFEIGNSQNISYKNLSLNNDNKIINVSDPTNLQDVSTKNYVDGRTLENVRSVNNQLLGDIDFNNNNIINCNQLTNEDDIVTNSTNFASPNLVSTGNGDTSFLLRADANALSGEAQLVLTSANDQAIYSILGSDGIMTLSANALSAAISLGIRSGSHQTSNYPNMPDYVGSYSEKININATEIDIMANIDLNNNNINKINTLQSDNINESTTNNGVNIEGVLIKDNSIEFNAQINSTPLDFYYEDSGTDFAFTGLWTSKNATFRLVRVGSLITLCFSDTVEEADASDTINSASPLDSIFRPALQVNFLIKVQDNGAIQHGSGVIQTDGSIIIYDDLDGNNFSGGLGNVSGFLGFSISYFGNN